MRKILIYIILLLIFILLFIGYKSYNLSTYSIKNNTIKTNSDITIKNDTDTKPNIVQGNLNIYLDLSKYKENESKTIYSKDEETYITFSEVTNIIQTTCRYSKLETTEYVDLMNKYNIKDEIGLIKYYIDNQNKKLNIINSISNIKTMYLSSFLIENLSIKNDISYLKGLNGVISNNTAYLFNNGNMYKIEFSSNIELEEIETILSTISFN